MVAFVDSLGCLFVQAIWEELQDVVHAVDAMVTKTPEEVGRK